MCGDPRTMNLEFLLAEKGNSFSAPFCLSASQIVTDHLLLGKVSAVSCAPVWLLMRPWETSLKEQFLFSRSMPENSTAHGITSTCTCLSPLSWEQLLFSPKMLFCLQMKPWTTASCPRYWTSPLSLTLDWTFNSLPEGNREIFSSCFSYC